jgi:hypothetical protein
VAIKETKNMKKTEYKVLFNKGEEWEYVHAWNVKEAEILAQAKRIYNGLDYMVTQTITVEKSTTF